MLNEKIQKSPFSPSKIPEYLAFIKWLQDNGISRNEILMWQNEQVEKTRKLLKILATRIQICPKCNIELKKMQLPNDTFKYKILMYCEQCGNERLT